MKSLKIFFDQFWEIHKDEIIKVWVHRKKQKGTPNPKLNEDVLKEKLYKNILKVFQLIFKINGSKELYKVYFRKVFFAYQVIDKCSRDRIEQHIQNQIIENGKGTN